MTMNLSKLPVWFIVGIQIFHLGTGRCGEEPIFVNSQYTITSLGNNPWHVRVNITQFWASCYLPKTNDFPYKTCNNFWFRVRIACLITNDLFIQIIFKKTSFNKELKRVSHGSHIYNFAPTYRLTLCLIIAISSLCVFIMVTAISR